MGKPILEAEKILWRVKEKTIIDIDSLKIYEGEHVALIGPNGSGKSSLLKLISFLTQPTAGKVTLHIAGMEGSSIIEKRRQMAVVFQEPLLLNMNVYDNVAYGLKVRKQKKQIKEKVEYWLDKLKIKDLRYRYPKNLSGGEAQRVSIARAMTLEPKILFLDEPFSALDAPTKEQLLEELSLIIKQTKVTSIFITHDFSDIPFMAEKVVVLYNGKIVQQGKYEEIFYQPASEEVAFLVGADNKYTGILIDHGVMQLSTGHMLKCDKSKCHTVAKGKKLKAFVRSEDVAMGSGKINNYTGFVIKISPHGLQYKLTIQSNDGFIVSTIIDKHQYLSLKPHMGLEVTVNIPSNRIHLIE